MVFFGDGWLLVQVLYCVYVGVVDTNLGMVTRWANVEAIVEVVKGLMNKYRFPTNCEISSMKVDVRLEGTPGRVFVV